MRRRKLGPAPKRPMPERFWLKVDKSGECWLWTSYINPCGYGQFQETSYRSERSHRVAWRIVNGPIPDGMFVLHRCDVRRCVNPAHLFLGTNDDNMADKVAKGRQARGAVCVNSGSFRPGANRHPARRESV